MTRTTPTRRPGFTLVELLVAMTVIIALATIALVVVPEVLSQDRTTDAAGTVRQNLMIAKARALRDGLPRGVRFLTGLDRDNAAKAAAGNATGRDGRLWATELQFIEQPPPLVPVQGEYLEFEFPPDASGALQYPPPPNVYYHPPADGDPDRSGLRAFINNEITAGRSPVIQSLRGDQRLVFTLSKNAADKLIPTGQTGATQLTDPPRAGAYPVKFATGVPQAEYQRMMKSLGGGTGVRVTTFWITQPAQPLLGEPTVQLPRNVCVDLNESYPAATPASAGTAGSDYDILFAPSGEVLYRGEGQIFLWVRDYTKTPDAVFDDDPATPGMQYNLEAFRKGGEQQVVAIKTKSGALGVFPIQWPDEATKQYRVIQPGSPPIYDDPFGIARNAASSP